MQRMKNIKIWIALFYILILSAFLYFLFSKFSLDEITTYNFVKTNSEFLINFRDQNLVFISICFVLFGICWILLQGFGSPLVLASGFLFGPYLGTILATMSLAFGGTLIYMFANFFFKDLIKKKFLDKFKNLEARFKKNEFAYMTIYRFIGGIPLQLQNLIPCMFSVSIKNFFFGSLLGFIPQAFIFSFLGFGLENQIKKNLQPPSFIELITSVEIYGPVLGFFSLLILIFILKNFFYKN